MTSTLEPAVNSVGTIGQIAKRYNISLSVLRRAWKQPGSPQPIQLMPNGASVYFFKAVDEWLETRPPVDLANRSRRTAAASAALARLRAASKKRGQIYHRKAHVDRGTDVRSQTAKSNRLRSS